MTIVTSVPVAYGLNKHNHHHPQVLIAAASTPQWHQLAKYCVIIFASHFLSANRLALLPIQVNLAHESCVLVLHVPVLGKWFKHRALAKQRHGHVVQTSEKKNPYLLLLSLRTTTRSRRP